MLIKRCHDTEMTQVDVLSLLVKETLHHEHRENTMMKKALLKIVVIVCVQNMQVSHVTSVRKIVTRNEMIKTHYQSQRFQGIMMKSSFILLQLNSLMAIHHKPQKKRGVKIH